MKTFRFAADWRFFALVPVLAVVLLASPDLALAQCAPPSDLFCELNPDGTILLTWTLNDVYDQIDVVCDGVIQAVLGGSSRQYVLIPPPGVTDVCCWIVAHCSNGEVVSSMECCTDPDPMVGADCPIDLSTGTTGTVVDPLGAVDPDWIVNFTPTSTSPGPAYSIAPVSSWTTASGANWVDPYNTGGSTSSGYDPVGNYQFQITFNLDLTQQSDFRLEIDVAVDNSASFTLNGNAVGSVTGFSGMTTLVDTTQSHFVHGPNVLIADVSNTSLWMGFLVEGGVSWKETVADISTGTTGGIPDPFTTIDPDWVTNFTPSVTTPGPAYSIAPVTAWTTVGNANWIDPHNSGGNSPSGYDLVGSYQFETTFTLDFSQQADFELIMSYAVDNEVDFFLNGISIGGGSSFGSMTSLTVSNQLLFLHGVNTLTANVENYSLWMGLLVEGVVVARCGETSFSDCNLNGIPDNIDVINGVLHDADNNGQPDECESSTGPIFMRGDADADLVFHGLLDGLAILGYQFIPGSPVPPCLEAADVDGDGVLNGITDGLYALTYQFVPGAPPVPAPFPECGEDPNGGSLGCESYGCP